VLDSVGGGIGGDVIVDAVTVFQHALPT
jgi:hypothetical protein